MGTGGGLEGTDGGCLAGGGGGGAAPRLGASLTPAAPSFLGVPAPEEEDVGVTEPLPPPPLSCEGCLGGTVGGGARDGGGAAGAAGGGEDSSSGSSSGGCGGAGSAAAAPAAAASCPGMTCSVPFTQALPDSTSGS